MLLFQMKEFFQHVLHVWPVIHYASEGPSFLIIHGVLVSGRIPTYVLVACIPCDNLSSFWSMEVLFRQLVFLILRHTQYLGVLLVE